MSKNLEFIVVAIGTINRIPAGINNKNKIKWKKVFSLLRTFVDVGGKSKFCVNYGNGYSRSIIQCRWGYAHRKILPLHNSLIYRI